jgi:4-hydroxy-2-oxoheptanedioate aldolase
LKERRSGIRDRLAGGETLVGTFLQTPHPIIAEFLAANSSLDFLCVEAEHSAMSVGSIQAMVAATQTWDVPALVRIANNDWVPVAQALDAGAAGIIAPRVNSAEEAGALVAAARYPPDGDRGIGPGRATRYGLDAGPDYRVRANAELVLAAQVETKKAVDDLEAIVAVPGLDLIFVGPADLASSLCLAPGSAELDEVIARIVSTSHGAGLATGIFAPGAEQAGHWAREGVQLILLASDLIFMAKGVAAITEAYRRPVT